MKADADAPWSCACGVFPKDNRVSRVEYEPDAARMMELISRLYPLHRTLASDGIDAALKIIGEYLPKEANYRILEFPSGQRVWTWKIPERYVVHRAYIEVLDRSARRRIADFSTHPLHLVSYSLPIDRVMTFDELEPHLHYSKKLPTAIPWQFRYYDRSWGFCLPCNEFKTLPRDAMYHVVIDVEFRDDFLRIGECDLAGNSDEYVLCVADVCHPYQANDSITGVAVMVEVIRCLATQGAGYFSIKTLFVPETIGSIAYLANNEWMIEKARFGLFCEMLGNDNTMILQRTRQDQHLLDQVARYALNNHTGGQYREGAYRTVVGNDEKVLNGPGVNIPTISITRWPYAEYHTSDDNPEIIEPERLVEAASVISEIIRVTQRNYWPVRKFRGPIFLSRYGLWVDPGSQPELNTAIDQIMHSLEGDLSVFEVAKKVGLDFWTVAEYVDRMVSAGLVEARRRPGA